ncbi:UDP-N-acetylmuramoyl-L-alanyl-D-glutamate--2,6-diaminopimelate ligase [Halobacillus shinanisalinarum]|uniref:UDP-N-acetylmuramyl-tripeptide synthetase n=1 Tax=Halobacillus shinanisalinarum TaxID=2932258 RepID=A0ABY4GTX5_9BACI|nr:UDP-N-acetylmuramoyl-L-alanyl-D-glutamate--2,6-diaminopimelate ligase [Halobacillus shinanisalinarum]UOQ91601.1 UDP-N-acetylmuramoyl-L-alanyl-D-glutamate--2,6-diaminopimelate ligase [Halobacillus shinanisalinarum]
MKLDQLLQDVPFQYEDMHKFNDIDIHGLTDSSNEVEPGCLFVAISGYQFDGHTYIQDAIKKGAAVIVGDQEYQSSGVPYIQVPNSRQALGILAHNYYHDPASSKIMVGITGTNGKTTTSYLMKHILEDMGYSCSLLGTIQNVINGQYSKTVNTTPNALTLNQLIDKSRDEVVIMEASSHGLAEYRLEGLHFDLCLFTNLTHEHLDYHGTIDQYYEVKKALFHKLKSNGTAVINSDDVYGEKLAEELRQEGRQTYTVGRSATNNLQILEQLSVDPPSVKIKGHDIHTLESPMAGLHNLYNTLQAYAAATQLDGKTTTDIFDSIRNFPGVPGRFTTYPLKNGSTVVIDYAHTADAVFNCLQTVHDAAAKKITHIFGFRGNRDLTKRQEMMNISAEMSDQYFLTMDDLNGVSEDDILQSLTFYRSQTKIGKGEIIPDRTLAIKKAINNSEPGEWIVITGKGHEQYKQQFSLPTHSDESTVDYVNNMKNVELN